MWTVFYDIHYISDISIGVFVLYMRYDKIPDTTIVCNFGTLLYLLFGLSINLQSRY